jgi:hypothetical protein
VCRTLLNVLLNALNRAPFHEEQGDASPSHVSRQSATATDEASRLNLVRIGVGLVLLHRYGSNAMALLYLPASHQQVAAVTFELISACLLTIGFVTPLAALGLFLFQQPADRVLLSWSLGSMVLQMVLLPMALLPAGARWSLDAYFKDSAFLRKLYGLWGTPSVERAAALRTMAFVSYGAVSLSAQQFHLTDPLWRIGLSQAYIFTNPYWSPHAASFRSFVDHWPGWALLASRAITAAMLFWEVFMLPLALSTRIGPMYVAAHGVLFFVLSAMFLDLAWLPYLELTLWALVFWVAPDLRISRATLRDDWRLAAATAVYVVGLTGAVVAFPWVHATNPVLMVSERLGALNADVFNYFDLRTNESYATVARIEADGTERLLPFNDIDGRRLGWHFSERTYYGISLPWRRVRIGHADQCWREDLDRRWVDQIVALDRGLGAPFDSRYAITFYAEPTPAPAIDRLGKNRGGPQIRCRVLFDPMHSQLTNGTAGREP